MSPIRQQLLDAIAQAPDTDLEATLHFLQSRQTPLPQPLSPSQQAWNQVVDRLNHLTPEQRDRQRQSVAELLQSWNNEPADDNNDGEESWESLKTALDQNRHSYRPLFP